MKSCITMHRSRGGVGVGRGTEDLDPPLPESHKNIGFSSSTGPDPLKNRKATKPVFNVGPSLARQRNTFNVGPSSARRHLMAFCWQADDGPLIVVLGSSLINLIKKPSKLDPLWQNFLDPGMITDAHLNLI